MELIRTEFEQWLQAKDPDKTVGTSGFRCRCPIACFITDKTGKAVQVHNSYYVDGIQNGGIDHPPWAIAFINRVDQYFNTAVTAKHALTILTGIEIDYSND